MRVSASALGAPGCRSSTPAGQLEQQACLFLEFRGWKLGIRGRHSRGLRGPSSWLADAPPCCALPQQRQDDAPICPSQGADPSASNPEGLPEAPLLTPFPGGQGGRRGPGTRLRAELW